MITSLTSATTLNIIQLQIELLIMINVINSPFHRNFHPSHHRRCQEDPRDLARGNSTKLTASTSTPTPTSMSNLGFFRRRGDAPRQQLWGGRVPRDLELPMGHPPSANHHRRVAQPPVQAQVPDCFRCQTGHPPAARATTSLRSWNEDLRMQEHRFLRDQEHERAMFMRKLDFHRR